jgi:hypothetical protein
MPYAKRGFVTALLVKALSRLVEVKKGQLAHLVVAF